jgi:TonB family protein
MTSASALRKIALLTLLLVGSPGYLSAQAGPTSANAPYELEDLDEVPKATDRPPPVFPRALSRAGLVGKVTVTMIIGTDGRVEDAMVVNSNNPWFERPALDAVMKWKFSPGRKDGQPVRVQATQPIDFTLDGEKGNEYWEFRRGKDQDKLPPELQWEVAPRVLATAYPVYPFELLQAKTKGTVTVTCIVGPTGKIMGAKLSEASSPEFGQAVLAMLADWEFAPATKAGQPCGAVFAMKYEFALGGADVPVSDSAKDILKELGRPEPRIYGSSEKGRTLDQPLKPVFRKAPEYPIALQGKGGDGEAVVEFYIDKKGDAQLPRIVSSTAPEFGYAAAQAVARWRFKPPLKDGKPVIARARVPVGFQAPKNSEQISP